MPGSELTDDLGMGVDDAIVLLLGAPDASNAQTGRISGITRLEKLVFLLEEETGAKEWLSEPAKFEAYNFGPFSAEVYRAVDMLSAAGLLLDTGSRAATTEDTWELVNAIGGSLPANDRYSTRDFTLTDTGWDYYRALKAELQPAQLDEVAQLKQRFARVPLRQLVRYVYERYRDYTVNSVIRDEILGPS